MSNLIQTHLVTTAMWIAIAISWTLPAYYIWVFVVTPDIAAKIFMGIFALGFTLEAIGMTKFAWKNRK